MSSRLRRQNLHSGRSKAYEAPEAELGDRFQAFEPSRATNVRSGSLPHRMESVLGA
jgi:hypothetical protein